MGKSLGDLDDLEDVKGIVRRAEEKKAEEYKSSLEGKTKEELFAELGKIISGSGAQLISMDVEKTTPEIEKKTQESKKEIQATSHITQQTPKMKKMWLIGELEGGTKFTGKTNLIGLARELGEQIQAGNAPDMIYFMGDILPDFAQFITRGQSAKKEVLEEGIDDLNGAVVAIKPHLTRIVDQILEQKPDTGIAVVVGPNDRDNIRLAHDRVVQMYSKDTRFIFAQIESYRAKIIGEEGIISTTGAIRKRDEAELDALKKRASEEERKAREEKAATLKQMEDALSKLKAEQEDTEELAQQIGKLKAMNGRKIDDLKTQNAIKISDREAHLKHLMQKIKENAWEAADDRRILALYDKLGDLWIQENADRKVEDVVKAFGGEANSELLGRIMRIRGPAAAEEIHNIVREQQEKVEKAKAETSQDLERERYDRLSKESLALAEIGAASAEMIHLQSQLDLVNAHLGKIDRDVDKARFTELEKQSKALANRIRKRGWSGVAKVMAASEKRIHELAEEGELYTHNLPGSKALHSLATEIAVEETLAALRTAFGRRVEIDLLTNNINDREIGFGYKIRASNNPKNTTSNYRRANMNDLKMEAQMGDNKGVRFAVLGHSQDGEATVAPLSDKSEEIMHLITTPLFVDTTKLWNVWNEAGKAGVKTRVTETVTRGPVSSGFWEVTFDDKKKVVETYKADYHLLEKADAERRDQLVHLVKRLKELPTQPLEEVVETIDKVQMRNKLPDEMDDVLFMKMLSANGIDPSDEKARKKLVMALEELRNSKQDDIRKMAEMPENRNIERMLNWSAEYFFPEDGVDTVKRISFLMVNDTHIGTTGYGLPTPILMEGLVRYWRENEDQRIPMVLYLGGDNLEANYKFIKNELNKELEISNIREFEERIKKTLPGGSEVLVKIKRDGYKAHLLDKRPIINIDEQAEVLVDSLTPLLNVADGIILVSGQHVNKNYQFRDRDEAKSLAVIIEQKTGKKSLPIMTIPGGDSGAGAVVLDEDFGIFVGHKIPKKLENMTLSQKVTLGADSHVHDFRVMGDMLAMIGSASSVINNYTTERGIPTSQSARGFTRLTITVAKDRVGDWKVHEAESEHISLELLRKRGYVQEDQDIKAFESKLNSMPVKMQTIKVEKKVKN